MSEKLAGLAEYQGCPTHYDIRGGQINNYQRDRLMHAVWAAGIPIHLKNRSGRIRRRSFYKLLGALHKHWAKVLSNATQEEIDAQLTEQYGY